MTENDSQWPDAVIERLKAYGERTNKQVGEAANEFAVWLKKEFSVDDPNQEDEYLLTEWSEMFVIETRNLGRGGSGRETTTYVGHIVALDDDIRDQRENKRDSALALFKSNQERAVDEGHIGIVTAKGGQWYINGKGANERVEGSKLPWFAFEHDDLILCLLNTNQGSNNTGKPMAPTSLARNLYFLGSEDNSNSIKMWKVSLNGKSMEADYTLHAPCKIQVVPPTQVGRDILYSNRDFSETIQYTDTFIPEDARHELRPERFLVNDSMHNEFVDLSELVEAHGDRKVRLPSGTTMNPIIITKGYVSSLNKEPAESKFDSTGRSFRMSITSLNLQSRNGRGSLHSEVTIWIPGRMYDEHHPFEFKDDSGTWVPYAERTQVIVVGRLRIRPYNDDMLPSITALGIYVSPRTARPGHAGGDTSLDQFGGDE